MQVSLTSPVESRSQWQLAALYERQSHDGCAQEMSNLEHDAEVDPLPFEIMQYSVGKHEVVDGPLVLPLVQGWGCEAQALVAAALGETRAATAAQASS